MNEAARRMDAHQDRKSRTPLAQQGPHRDRGVRADSSLALTLTGQRGRAEVRRVQAAKPVAVEVKRRPLRVRLIDLFSEGRFLEGKSAHSAATRRMLPELKEAERRLTSWGDHTRAQTESGLPRRSVTERANEGGILAGDPRPPTFLSDADAEIDRLIARFPPTWQRTARGNWQYLHEAQESRAARAGLSVDSLKRRCEVIRWAVKIALEDQED